MIVILFQPAYTDALLRASALLIKILGSESASEILALIISNLEYLCIFHEDLVKKPRAKTVNS